MVARGLVRELFPNGRAWQWGRRWAAAVLPGVVLAMTVVAVPAAAHAVGATPGPAAGGSSGVDSALEQAARTGKPVTVSSYTTETDSLVARPDGKLALTQALAPVRKRVGTGWQPLNATLEANTDGSFSPAVVPGALRLSGGGTGPVVTMYVAGTSLSLSLPMVLPKPTVSGPTATYAGVLPGVDLTVTSDVFGSISESFVVHDATAARNPALQSLRFTTQAAGLTLSADAAGNIVGSNAVGSVLVSAPAPTMWDSRTDASRPTATDGSGEVVDADSGEPARSTAAVAGAAATVAPVQVTVDSGGFTLVPDAGLLSSPGAVYPLYIDPGFTAAR